MFSKAKAICPNGHTVEFGPCGQEVRRFFFFKSICMSTDHDILSRDEIRCRQCKTIHLARVCPECKETVPVVRFKEEYPMSEEGEGEPDSSVDQALFSD